MPNNKQKITSDLIKLGINIGDTLFLRISYRSLGQIDGGPKELVDALIDAVGKNGTIVATAFPIVHRTSYRWFNKKNKIRNVHIKNKKISSGLIPSIMMDYPMSYISDQPLYPYVAIGKNAKELIELYSYNSKPYEIIEILASRYHAKCLRIGGALALGTTHIALTESMIRNNHYQKRISYGLYYSSPAHESKWGVINTSYFCTKGYKKFFDKYLEDSVLAKGMIGNGEATLTRMQDTLTLERQYIRSYEDLLCNEIDCETCRVTYKQSRNISKYILSQIKIMLKDFSFFKLGISLKNIIKSFEIVLFGTKCQ